MGPSMSTALAENFSPGWKRASAGVGFGDALSENEGTSFGNRSFEIFLFWNIKILFVWGTQHIGNRVIKQKIENFRNWRKMKFLVNKLLDHQKDSGKSKNSFQSVIYGPPRARLSDYLKDIGCRKSEDGSFIPGFSYQIQGKLIWINSKYYCDSISLCASFWLSKRQTFH